jgi:osmotically inducible protein OsmC
MPVRHASASWEGGLQSGAGVFRAGSGAFSGPYSFGTRFQEIPGTNPEELIAAAHAGCLSMALSGVLERAGTPPQRVETKAACTIEKVGDAFRITRMQLTVRGKVPGLSQAQFAAAAESAKNGCPVSNALKGNVEFVLDAQLE